MVTLRFIDGGGLAARHLLVTVDASDEARRAVTFVADFFGGHAGLRVTLLYVVLESVAESMTRQDTQRTWSAARKAQALAILDGYRGLLVAGGVPETRVDLLAEIVRAPSLAAAIIRIREGLKHDAMGDVPRPVPSGEKVFLDWTPAVP